MPFGRGVGQIAKVNVCSTICEISGFNPPIDEGYCGDDLTVYINIICGDSNVYYGDYDIINDLDGSIVFSGTANGSSIAAVITGLSGFYYFKVKYKGYPNEYLPSESDVHFYYFNNDGTGINITYPSPETSYCYYDSLTCTAVISSVSGNTPTGNVNFIFRQGSTNTNLGSSAIGFGGFVNFTVPANTGTPNVLARIFAEYPGDGCFLPSSDSVRLLSPITSSATTTTLSILTHPENPIYIDEAVSLSASVTSVHFNPVDIGTVTFKAIKVSTPSLQSIIATTAVNSSGQAFATIAVDSLLDGDWNIQALYTPLPGGCLASSNSSLIEINISSVPQ